MKKRNARTGRNPKTGEVIVIAEKYIVSFKAGKGLDEKINVKPEQKKAKKKAK